MMLAEGQVKRLLAHCEKIHQDAPGQSVRNEGWIEALRLVLKQDTHPIASSKLPDYKVGYDLLMKVWTVIPDSLKSEMSKELKQAGLQ